MMRRIVAPLLPLFFAAPLMAQTMVGIRAGLNRATFSDFVEEDLAEVEALGGAASEDARTGVVAGIDVALPVANAFELRVGGAYAQKGYSLSVSGLGGGGSSGFEMDYLQFSTLARVGSSRDGPLSVGVLLGPWAALRLSCNLNADFDFEGFGSFSESESCKDESRMWDYGIAAGGGVELAVSKASDLGLIWCTRLD